MMFDVLVVKPLLQGSTVHDKEEGGMCVACGTWTCSQKCHTKYLSEPSLCTFHHNFARNLGVMSMRSLRNPVIRQLQGEGLAVGTPIGKTSRSYVFGSLSESNDYIYIQRGYRQYGQMQVSITVTAERNLPSSRSLGRKEPRLLHELHEGVSSGLL